MITADDMIPTDRTVPDELPSDDAPSEGVPVVGDRPVCQETGCYKPCRKRKGRDAEGYHPYCAEHLTLHNAADEGRTTPNSRQPRNLQAKRQQSAQRIEQNVTGWLGLTQMALVTSGDQYCAWAIGQEGPHIAKALGDLSQDYPLLKKVLETGDKWGSLSVLVFHMARLGLMVSVHHEWLPWEGPIRFLVPQPPPRHSNTPPPQAPQESVWDTNRQGNAAPQPQAV